MSPNPGRGPAAAGAHRVGRRAVAHHAGDQDADRDRRGTASATPSERPPSDVGARADLRRGRRRHRRARRRRRRAQAPGARLGVPGALHHAPAADCGVRRHALPDREARRATGGHARTRHAARRERRASRRLRRMLGGAAITDGMRASAREMLERRQARRPRSGGERRKRKAKGESERPQGRRPTEETVTWRVNT